VKEYITPAQAAELLHLSSRTLERKRCDGTGPRFHKLGRRVVYQRDEIDAWVEQNGFGSTSEFNDQGRPSAPGGGKPQ
jgi:excisionase family DNA binding protein